MLSPGLAAVRASVTIDCSVLSSSAAVGALDARRFASLASALSKCRRVSCTFLPLLSCDRTTRRHGRRSARRGPGHVKLLARMYERGPRDAVFVSIVQLRPVRASRRETFCNPPQRVPLPDAVHV